MQIHKEQKTAIVHNGVNHVFTSLLFPAAPAPVSHQKKTNPHIQRMASIFFPFQRKLFLYENRGKECKPFAVLYYILAGMSEGGGEGKKKGEKDGIREGKCILG